MIISLLAIVPTIMLTLVLLCIVNYRRTNRVKGNLRETNQSLELLRAATTVGRNCAAARMTGSAQAGAGSSSASPGPVINIHNPSE